MASQVQEGEFISEAGTERDAGGGEAAEVQVGETEAGKAGQEAEVLLEDEWECKWNGAPAKLTICEKELQIINLPAATTSRKKGSDPARLCLPWLDVLGVEEGGGKGGGEGTEGSLVLHYIHRQPSNHWQPARCCLTLPAAHLPRLVPLLKDRCHAGKPRRLLVIINPISGRKAASKLYRTKVAPVFQLASIETDVKETEGPNHAVEIPRQYDLSTVDGIVVVGGDGFFYQVLNGLLRRTQEDAGVDLNDKNATLHPPQVPIGLIPGGTGNRVSRVACGDIASCTTAALHITRGVTEKFNILTVYTEGKFLAFSGFMACYGGWAEMLQVMERKRSMGYLRFPVVMLGMAFKRKRTFRASLEYLQVDDVTPQQATESGDATTQDYKWKKVEVENDTFTDILTYAAGLNVQGTKMFFDPCSSGIVLLAEKPCSGSQAFKGLIKMSTMSSDYLTNPVRHVVDKVVAWRVRHLDWEPQGSAGGDAAASGGVTDADTDDLNLLFNIDGELLHLKKPEAEVWLHPRFLPFFTSRQFQTGEQT